MNYNSNGKNMEAPRKIVEPLITIPKPRPSALHQQQMQQQQHSLINSYNNNNNSSSSKPTSGASIYSELLDVIEEMNLYVRPCYLGHRASLEKVRQLINRARQLVRLCMLESEKSSCQ